MIESWAGRAGAPFEWVKPPILNAMTRLAVEADPARGTFRAVGYEAAPGEEDRAVPATQVLDWSAAS
ncbi:hypothetical protein [Methylorubrum salsuginis]|uniref:Uncharacterized protein n=1 Tax=Methylorubrum salsuginis TaxID=414703 RepID=A0A1I3YWH0_9HYPH|nr:hypothetical protein [Methylorubrum salsuginis]SFK36175.1 hypothetical protein SAMN04488125_101396 [Methylorubrum salsuginis]